TGLCTFPSSPTRRSSDLHVEAAERIFHRAVAEFAIKAQFLAPRTVIHPVVKLRDRHRRGVLILTPLCGVFAPRANIVELKAVARSEEHTSELQSRENLVC